MAPAKQSDYFVLPNFLVMVAVVAGMSLTVLCTFKPDVVPYSYLGPVGDLAHYLAYKQVLVMRTICYTAIFMHVFEGCYAYYLAGMKELSTSTRLKWLMSTFCLGIFSMYYLLKYNPSKALKRD